MMISAASCFPWQQRVNEQLSSPLFFYSNTHFYFLYFSHVLGRSYLVPSGSPDPNKFCKTQYKILFTTIFDPVVPIELTRVT
jgi:hypothetical protein